jgi:RNA polymerase sigma-70 factor, ECF subfamily
VSSSDRASLPAGLSQWIEAARNGSPEALGQMFAYCRQYLLAVANEELEADLQAKVGASDLVQDTLLEAHRDFGQFRGRSEAEVLAWLRQILLHNVANASRQYRQTDKRQIQREVDATGSAHAWLDALADDGSTPSAQAVRREQDEALERALGQLPARLQRIIKWRTDERCSFEQIGRRIGRSSEAARKLWARAIDRLQQILGSGDDSR